jgi:chaperonin GroEL
MPIEVTEDIVDPAKVLRVAVETAASTAGILLTTEVAIAIKKEKEEQLPTA